jgi:Fur family ferric uptake transcriptional regulator
LSCETIFLNQLHKHGFRLTIQREMVLDALHQVGHPASAEELHEWVAGKNANVELSTVYRTLDLLNSMNLVSVIDTGNKTHLFELSGEHASHLCLVCRVCGKIIRVDTDPFLPLFENVRSRAGFHVDLSNLTIPGLCEACQQAELIN